MRVLRGEDWCWIDTEPTGLAPVRHTCEVYSLGRDVKHEDVTESRSIVSLIGPDARAEARRRPARGRALLRGGRARALRGHRPRRRRDRRAAAWPSALGVEAVSEDGGRVPARRVGPAAARARHGRGHHSPGGRPQRARRGLREGLLRRPGDRRPAALARQAQPPPARAEAVRARPSTATRSRSASARSARSARRASRPRSAPWRWPSCGARPAPGDTVAVGSNGTTARGRRPALRTRLSVCPAAVGGDKLRR